VNDSAMPESIPFSLSGTVAVVTGSGRGIGRALAMGLADQGAAIVIADISTDLATETADLLKQQSKSAISLGVDVTDPSDVERLFQTVLKEFGRLDVLVNNAGGAVGVRPTVEVSVEEWRATLDLCLTSAFLCSQQAGRLMMPQGNGSIINIASVFGIVSPDPSLYDPNADGSPREAVAYAAAKGGLISMTRALAVYWAPHGIRVNAVAPGMVKTEILGRTLSPATWQRLADRTPLGRAGRPMEMAGAVVFLASHASDFVTGQTLVVDGGWTSW
jgi:NAD(P)-dependent dehydrogenase (short-subunit alcohol dehydrogenase family)